MAVEGVNSFSILGRLGFELPRPVKLGLMIGVVVLNAVVWIYFLACIIRCDEVGASGQCTDAERALIIIGLVAPAIQCTLVGVVCGLLACRVASALVVFFVFHSVNIATLLFLGIPIYYLVNTPTTMSPGMIGFSQATIAILGTATICRFLLYCHYFRRNRDHSSDCCYAFLMAGFLIPMGGD